jgi:hypothetical protein
VNALVLQSLKQVVSWKMVDGRLLVQDMCMWASVTNFGKAARFVNSNISEAAQPIELVTDTVVIGEEKTRTDLRSSFLVYHYKVCILGPFYNSIPVYIEINFVTSKVLAFCSVYVVVSGKMR